MSAIEEQDLLAWIEGELPNDRRAIVEAALNADPELRRWADAAVKDRSRLQSWGDAASSAVPPGLLDDAIAAAEREALVGQATAGVIGPAGGRFRLSRTQLAAAAGFVLLAGGAVLFAPVIWPAGPGSTGPVALNNAEDFEPEQLKEMMADAPSDHFEKTRSAGALALNDRADESGADSMRDAAPAGPIDPIAVTANADDAISSAAANGLLAPDSVEPEMRFTQQTPADEADDAAAKLTEEVQLALADESQEAREVQDLLTGDSPTELRQRAERAVKNADDQSVDEIALNEEAARDAPAPARAEPETLNLSELELSAIMAIEDALALAASGKLQMIVLLDDTNVRDFDDSVRTETQQNAHKSVADSPSVRTFSLDRAGLLTLAQNLMQEFGAAAVTFREGAGVEAPVADPDATTPSVRVGRVEVLIAPASASLADDSAAGDD